MGLYEILGLLLVHFIADYLCQTRKMAEGKSKYWGDLLNHTSLYSVIFWFYALYITSGDILVSASFAGITFVCHTITDYNSSRMSSRYYEEGQFRKFFIVLGFDQWLHFVQLFFTYWILLK